MIATQKGKNIFSAMISFSVPEISQLSYQRLMPKVLSFNERYFITNTKVQLIINVKVHDTITKVPSPYELKTEEEQLRSILLNPKAAKYHKSIEMRLAQPLMVERRFFVILLKVILWFYEGDFIV